MSFSRSDHLQNRARLLLAPHGLSPFGWFRAENDRSALLVGNIGSSLWSAFIGSDHYADGAPDAMDRWTKHVVQPLAEDMNAEPRFPFGEPRWPFQNYARAATGMQQSPIGLLVHPEYGLWTAFRVALVFSESFEIPVNHAELHPCDNCEEMPCLSACPVEAFKNETYAYQDCRSHVGSESGLKCRSGGCIARHACPVGKAFAYEPEQQAFHMAAFV